MKNKFVIVTPAFNCENTIENTIKSISVQTHKNWEMIILDDMSTDNTKLAIEQICDYYRLDFGNKVKLISRTEKYGEVRNTLDVCSSLDDEDIVVRIDAGDWITDMGCFEILDQVYSQIKPAVLWTNQRWAWSGQSICGPINPEVSVYEQPWKSSHLKTFRAKELRGINKNNFLDDEGDWITIACDQAIFLPMMERARLAGRPLAYLPLVMYHYDIDLENPGLFQEDRSKIQKISAERIRERGYIV